MDKSDDNFFTIEELADLTGIQLRDTFQQVESEDVITDTESTDSENERDSVLENSEEVGNLNGVQLPNTFRQLDSDDMVTNTNSTDSENEEDSVIQNAQEMLNAILEPNNMAFPGELLNARKRKKKADPSSWKYNKNKLLRMQGKNYFGKESHSIAKKSERKIGPTCTSSVCEKSKLFNCSKFLEDTRIVLFNQYWNSMDWNQKRIYVTPLVDVIHKRKTKKLIANPRKRLFTHIYFLKLGDEKKRVCEKMFLSTLGIKHSQLKYWIKHNGKLKNIVLPASPTEISGTLSDPKLHLQNFLKSLPTMPSNYCRAQSLKLYLEPIYQSKAEVHRHYEEKSKLDGSKSLSYATFHRAFSKMNISIFTPKKDRCDTCTAYEVGNITESIYTSHIKRKEEARDCKTKDKEAAKEGKCHVLTMDVQAVKLSPVLNASALYFRRKLLVHNFSVYDLNSHEVCCYWWDETEADLSASTFANCICNFLQRYQDQLPIIIYSDGCGYQNRNSAMSNALLNYSIKYGKTIIQKYFEKGHSQMEVDSVHSSIEVKLRHKNINTPTDYIDICKSARSNPFQYEVKYLDHTFFKDFAAENLMRYKKIRPGIKKGDPKVIDIKELKYSPDGKIYFNLTYGDSWTALPCKKSVAPLLNPEFPQLFTERLPIALSKWEDLQYLKSVLHQDYHSYYDNISYK